MSPGTLTPTLSENEHENGILTADDSQTEKNEASADRGSGQQPVVGLSIVVPVLNEAESLGDVLKKLLAYCDEHSASRIEIIVVDDGSSDESCRIAQMFSPRVKVLAHGVNRGYGSALVTGAKAASSLCVMFLVIGGYALPSAPNLAWSQVGSPRQQLLDTWAARQKRITSVDCRWTEQRTDIKGSLPSLMSAEAVIPPSDHTYEGQCELLVSDQKSRFSYDGYGWDYKAGQYERMSRTAVFDGSENRSFSPPNAATNYPRGTVQKNKQNYELATVHIRPLIWWARPLDDTMRGFAAQDLTMTGRTGIVDGSVCEIVRYSSTTKKLWDLWVDPNKHYNIVRARISDGTEHLEIKYHLQSSSEWVPASWTYTKSDNGNAKIHLSSSVSECLLNPAIEPSEFTLEFPAGTWVHDAKRRQQYIVRAVGPNRPISSADAGKSYEEINRPGLGFWWKVLFYVGGACAIVFLIIGVRRLACGVANVHSEKRRTSHD